MRSHGTRWAPGLLLSGLALLAAVVDTAPAAAAEDESVAADLAAARAVFDANLDAIRNRDTEAYLDCYLDSERLARTGPVGFTLGYEGLAASAGSGWPEVFEAQDLELVPVRSGIVYGTYRYRVRFDGVEQAGLSERLFVDTVSGWKIAVTTAFPALSGTPPPPRALTGATLVDGTGGEPVEDAVVLMRNGTIDCAGAASECVVPDGVERMDLSGHWITPGLVDAHVHFSQTGWADGRPDFVDVRRKHPYIDVESDLREHPERFFRSYLCSGVTAVFDVGGYPWTWEMASQAESNTEAPRVAAAGPLLSTLDFWLNLPGERQFIYLRDMGEGRKGVRYLAGHGADAVKIWFIRAEDRDFGVMSAIVKDAGKQAAKAGLPLIVHATGLDEAKVAVEAGAHLLVHSVWDQLVDDEFVALMKEHGTIYTPTLTVARGYLRLGEAIGAREKPTVDDPNRCVDVETLKKVASSARLPAGPFDDEDLASRRSRIEERERFSADNLKRLAEAGVPIAMGTDAGNPMTLHGPSVYAELEAMQAAGLSPMEVLVAATQNGARAMGRAEDLGTLEAGKAADLLVLAADPVTDAASFRRITHVARGGVLRPIAEFRRGD